VTDNVYCLVKIIETDERIIAAVQFENKPFDFLGRVEFTGRHKNTLRLLFHIYTV